MKSVLIVGCGVVGSNLYSELSKLNPSVYDKYKHFSIGEQRDKYDFCFICVDTPYIDENNVCDTIEVENAIQEHNANIYIIKSTILPNTTSKLIEKYNKKIIFSPEFYGATQHCNNFNFNFTILGGKKEDCIKVQQLLQNVYDARHLFRIVDSRLAELCKYMSNSWLATKVSFCVQFYEVCKKLGINYEELRECFILDKERINPSHTFVYEEHPYWDSHCLNKDVLAIAQYLDLDLLKDIIKFNNNQKKNITQQK